MARRLDPTIKKQQVLRAQLEGALQGEILTKVRRATEGVTTEFVQRTKMVANGLKVTKETMEGLFNICEEVKQSLEFTDDVNFYIQGSSDINAYAYISEDADKPHIIVINSALFNLMDEMELRYIIGHEIGHLVNKDSYICRLYYFIYPDEDGAPEILKSRMHQYEQLAEYAADRYGYQACMDLGACITAMYKLSCGLDLKKMGVSIDSLINQNLEKTDYLVNNGIVTHSDHPDIPLRIHAILMYAKCPTLKALDEGMEMLFTCIPEMYHSETDENMAILCATAGIKLAAEDGKIDKLERDIIVEEIAKYEMEASKLLKLMLKSDVEEYYWKALHYIVENAPEKVEDLLRYYIDLSFADKEFQPSEMDMIIEMGKQLEVSEDVIYNYIIEYLRLNYFSLADSL
ncbi:MAG: M48 family metallopeptidase [Bacteroidaceae bacterium]|nr:M48 family metallopeptidase [Bacteroidaceae bacterium]